MINTNSNPSTFFPVILNGSGSISSSTDANPKYSGGPEPENQTSPEPKNNSVQSVNGTNRSPGRDSRTSPRGERFSKDTSPLFVRNTYITQESTSEHLQKQFKNILKYRPKPTLTDENKLIEETSSLPALDKSLKISMKKSMRKPIQLQNPFDEFDIAEKAVIDFVAPAECAKSMIITNNRRRPKYELDLFSKQSLETAFNYFCVRRPEGIVYSSLGQPRAIQLGPDDELYVGTSLGVVVAYNLESDQIEKVNVNDTNSPASPVAVIKLSPNNTHLLVGFENGIISICDIINRKTPCRTFSFGIQGILALEFIKPEPITFLASNLEGRMSQIQITKPLAKELKYTETLLLNNSAGVVFDIRTLLVRRVLKKDDEGPREVQLVALATSLKAVVMISHPSPHLVASIPISDYNQANGTFPYISWGWVQSQVYEFVGLAVGIGKVLEIVRFGIEEEVTWRRVKYFVFDSFIISVEFIKPNLLSIVDSDGILHILHFNDLKHGNYLDQHLKTNRPNEVLPARHYREDLKVYLLQPKVRVYHKLIFLSHWTNEILLLCRDEFVRVHFYSPLEFLDQIERRKKYKKLFTVTIDLFYGNLKEIYEITEKITKEQNPAILAYFKEKLLTCIYCKLFSSDEEGNPQKLTQNVRKIIKVASALIDFCIEINFEEYLFTIVKKSFQVLGLNEHFINALEPFILMNRITFIPEPQLYEVISHFHAKSDLMTVQRLIMNLDLKKIHINELVHLCLELELFMPLEYLASRGGGDYLASFNKLVNEFNKTYSNKQFDQAERYCKTLFWYIRLCLQKRRVYSSEEISFEAWASVLKEIVLVVFKRDKLTQFFKTSPSHLLTIIALFFEPKIAEPIEAFEGKMILNLGRSSLQSYRNNEEIDLYVQMYNAVLQCLTDKIGFQGEERENASNSFHFFNAIISELQPGKRLISERLAYDCVLAIVQNPEILSAELLAVHYSVSKSILKNATIDQFEKEEDFTLWRRDTLTLSLIKYCQGLMIEDVKLQKALDEITESTSLTSGRSFMSYLKGDHNRSIEIYTYGYVPKCIQRKVFSWILQLLEQFQEADPEIYKQIKQFTLSRIAEIVAIDTHAAKQLLDSHFEEEKSEVAKMLQKTPDLQLDYIEQVIESFREIGKSVEDSNLIETYLKLLCTSKSRARRKQVIRELAYFDGEYQIHEILRLCQQNSLKEAMAYLEERIGNIEAAVLLRLSVLHDVIQEKIGEAKPLTPERELKIRKRWQTILDKLNEIADPVASAQVWKTSLSIYIKVVKNIKVQCSKKAHSSGYLFFLSELLQEFIYRFLLKTSSNNLIDIVQSSSDIISISTLKNPFQLFYSGLLFQKELLKSSLMIYQEYSTELTDLLADYSSVGTEKYYAGSLQPNGKVKLLNFPKTEEDKCMEAIETAQNNQINPKRAKSNEKITKPDLTSSLVENLNESAVLNEKLNNPNRKMLLNKLRLIDRNETHKIIEEFALGWRDKS